jgi:hypothetical protein
MFFGEGGVAAISRDELGSQLPASMGPWVMQGIEDINEAEHAEVVSAVKMLGYYLILAGADD